MTIDEIKELIHVVHESGVAELEVQRGDNRVRIRRSSSAATQEVLVVPTAVTSAVGGIAATPQQAALQSPPSLAAHSSEPPTNTDLLSYVKSPIVGTYYDSPTPGAPSFVKVGDRVSKGQTLCIIESMKLMNEIESEVDGIVVNKLIENGRPVEYGESLFSVKPA